MRILISGASGMVGTALSHRLEKEGHEAVRLVRPERRSIPAVAPGKTILWDPSSNQFDETQAEGMDALVHLAGASIAEGRWNDARKNLLRSSRVNASARLYPASHL